MMSPAEHYVAAERLLALVGEDGMRIGRAEAAFNLAKIHATLATVDWLTYDRADWLAYDRAERNKATS